jgi:hypothetical protein
MTTVHTGVPGHDDGTVRIRLRRGTLHDDPKLGRVWDYASVGPYELICQACGDDPSLNYGEVSPWLQEIRGNYWTADQARGALARHVTSSTR